MNNGNNAVFDGFTTIADPIDYFKKMHMSPSVQQDNQCPRGVKKQISPLDKIFKDSMASPYNTKKYAFNNNVNMRTMEAEL